MTSVMTNRGWLAAFAAAILCLAAFGLVSTAHAASVSSLKIGSGTTAPNTDITIHLTASGTDIGSYGVNVQYDATLVSPTACTSTNGVCNTTFAVNTVRINGSNLSGISGTDVDLGSITFHAGGTTGTAALTISANAVSDKDGADLTVTPTNGSIVIAAATAAPTAAPTAAATATAAPTATAATLPKSGGPTGDSSSMSLGWLLGAAGLMVVAGGAWTLARARREEN